MGAPSPELVDMWLARTFNAQDIEAAAAMYHPDARVVRLEYVHGNNTVAQGAEEIRETMAGYVGLKPHMDVVVHHTTVAGDYALCRSQWRITGTDQSGKEVEVHHHGMEVMRRLMEMIAVLSVTRARRWVAHAVAEIGGITLHRGIRHIHGYSVLLHPRK